MEYPAEKWNEQTKKTIPITVTAGPKAPQRATSQQNTGEQHPFNVADFGVYILDDDQPDQHDEYGCAI